MAKRKNGAGQLDLLQDIRDELKTGFAGVNQRLDATNQRLDATNQRLDETNGRLSRLEGRFDHLLEFSGEHWRQMDDRLQVVERRLRVRRS